MSKQYFLFLSSISYCTHKSCNHFLQSILQNEAQPFFSFALQDVSQDDIPIMLVGNKCDLRPAAGNCVPTSYGEKLAMVTANKHLIFGHILGHNTLGTKSSTLTCSVNSYWRTNDFLVSPHRRTTLCSVRQVQRMGPTSWRPCCTWQGETQPGQIKTKWSTWGRNNWGADALLAS